jgi:DNA-binding SARP family transcriptional activator
MPDNPATHLHITLFGGLRARVGDGEPIQFPPQQTGVLLAYLALHLGRVHARDDLAAVIWPDHDSDTARPNLRQQLYALRRQLAAIHCPDSAVLATRTTVQLNPRTATTDTARFNSLVASARAADEPSRRVGMLERAIEVYGGELLPGFYQDNFTGERERFSREFRDALVSLALARAEAGDIPAAIQAATRATDHDPLHEESHRVLMRLLAKDGMTTAALRHYQELERTLQRELGARPSATTEQVVQEIRSAATRESARVNDVGSPGEVGEPAPQLTRKVESTGAAPAQNYALSAGAVLLLLVVAMGWFIVRKPQSGRTAEINSDTPLELKTWHAPSPAPPLLDRTAWVATYKPGPGDGDSEATDIAYSDNGGLLVTGLVQTHKHDVDILTLGYDENGHKRWEDRYNGPGNDLDRGRVVAFGPDGSGYVLGESDNGHGNDATRLSGLDIVLLKYDRDGHRSSSWPSNGFGPGVRRFNGPANGEDTPVAIRLDWQGNVFVLGTSWGTGPNSNKPGRNVVLLKYSPTGGLVWKYCYDGGHGDDIPAAFAQDQDGDFFIAATSRSEPTSGPETDIVVLRASHDGRPIWQRRWGAGNRADDTARAIDIDGGGNIHVVGEGRGAKGTPDEDAVGFIHLKLDSNGSLIWQRGATNEEDRLTTVLHVMFAEQGLAVVTGYIRKPDSSTYVRTLMQDADGLIRWSDTTWGCEVSDGPSGLGWGPGGHIFVSGMAHWPKRAQDIFVEEYEPSGKPLTTREYDSGLGWDFSRAMTVVNGSPVVVGQSQGKRTRDLTIARFK